VIRAVLLAKLLRLSGLSSVGVGTSTYLFVSVLLIYNGLPKGISLELAAAAAVGAASLMEFIDSLVGISGFLQRRQESVFLIDLEKDIHSGKTTFAEALKKVIERQFSSDVSNTPWYNLKSRKAIKTKFKNRSWIIDNVLPYTLCSAGKDMSIDFLCRHLYEMDKFVSKHKFFNDDVGNPSNYSAFYSGLRNDQPLTDLLDIVRENSKELLFSEEGRVELEREILGRIQRFRLK
jgi:hypothetical protein